MFTFTTYIGVGTILKPFCEVFRYRNAGTAMPRPGRSCQTVRTNPERWKSQILKRIIRGRSTESTVNHYHGKIQHIKIDDYVMLPHPQRNKWKSIRCTTTLRNLHQMAHVYSQQILRPGSTVLWPFHICWWINRKAPGASTDSPHASDWRRPNKTLPWLHK